MSRAVPEPTIEHDFSGGERGRYARHYNEGTSFGLCAGDEDVQETTAGTSNLLGELKKLSVVDRLAFLEAALHEIRHEIQPPQGRRMRTLTRTEKDDLLAEWAGVMAPEYANDSELIAFTAIDGEDFVEAR